MIGSIFSLLFMIFLLLACLILAIGLFIGGYRDNEPILYFFGIGVLLFALTLFFNFLGI